MTTGNFTTGNFTTGNFTKAPVRPPYELTEGGILNGVAVLSTPLSVVIVQVLLILSLSRFLSWIFAKINQPRVIAEVIAGILLGPTACGHIPGFRDTIFPPDKLKYLKLVAELGLIFFLFIVGLELDLTLLKSNAKKAVFISACSILIPLALGGVVGIFLKETIMTHDVNAGSVILFIGVAYAITAFPVLARILSELKLLGTPVGIITISSSAVGDAVAWCLLALTVAIVSAANPLNSLYIFLLLIGFCTLMFLIGVFGFRRLEITDNPSQNVVMLAIMLCLIASWFTDFIGVHAIFGAFITGVILPRKANFNIHVTEKIEDLVSIIFLPLYFAYSGLNTNIGLLNSGEAWGAVFLVIFGACFAKIVSASLAAKFLGLLWREALAVGILMNTRGLVELIVLNIGLTTGVLDPPTFAIMVLMALITTFMTTPLIQCVYPHKYYSRFLHPHDEKDKRGTTIPLSDTTQLNLLVCVSPVPPMALIMNIVQMFANYNKKAEHTTLHISTAQLIEVSDRYSSVLQATSDRDDSMTPVFEGFATLNGVKMNTQKIISSQEHFSEDILELIQSDSIDVVFYPWQLDLDHETRDSSYHMIPELLKIKSLTVSILIKTGVAGVLNLSEAKFLVPFFGGADDRKAVEIALSFGFSTCIIYFKTEKELEADDARLLEVISHFAEKDPSVVYAVKEYSELQDNITDVLKEEYQTSQFSLLSVGYDSQIPLQSSSEPSSREFIVGTLAGKLIENDFPTNILVVKSGENYKENLSHLMNTTTSHGEIQNSKNNDV